MRRLSPGKNHSMAAPDASPPPAPDPQPRLAAAEDFPQLWALDQACFAPEIAYSQREMQAWLRAPGAFALVLDSAPGVIGAFLLAIAGRRQGHIVTLDVLPACRRRGWARRLMAAAEIRLRQAGLRTIRLETAVDNVPAIALYARLGYRIHLRLPGYYPGGLDGLQLIKQIQP